MEAMSCIKIPLIGKHGKGKFALVDGDYDGEYFSQFRWSYTPTRSGKSGYVRRKDRIYSIINPKTGETKFMGMKNVYLHDEVCHKPKGMWVDHIDRDTLNNRSYNLRAVTPKENAQNREITPRRAIYTPEQLKEHRRQYDKARYQQLKTQAN